MTSRTSTMLMFLLACAGGPAAAHAQGAATAGAASAAGRIMGIAVHARSGGPIAGASIAVRSAQDSALVSGGFTRDDGSFRIDGLRPGRYLVRVRLIGYAPVVRSDVRLTPAAAAVDLGRLELTPVATELATVAVTAEQGDVRVAPDRTSYTVKDMPSASGGSAVDVLRNVPSVEVDGDNKVSLRGNENVVVQINGRLSPMRGDALGGFLAQLPANMVASIEVVPNPSAKNDPEGMAGILNIVLKENTELGMSGGLTMGGGSTGQVNASGNLGYQRGPLTLFASYGLLRDERAVSGYTDRAGLQDGLLPYLEGDIRGANRTRSHSLNASADYTLGAAGALSSNLVVSDRAPTRTNDNLYRELDADRALVASYLRSKLMTADELSVDFTLAYKRPLARPGDGLSTEIRVNRAHDTDDILLTDQALGTATAAPEGMPALETNVLDERATQWTVQSDLTRTLAPGTKLEAGYKGTLRRLDNRFEVATSADGGATYAPALARDNAFAYDEQVHAAYGVLSQGLGRLELQGGLRAERVATAFHLATASEPFDDDYVSLYPSALAAYTVDEARLVKASYSKRVTRPDTRQLNPFGWREDAVNQFQGNPALEPEYTHAFELGYQQSFAKGTVQITPFARHTVNAIRFIRTVTDAGVSITTFQNVATNDSYGTDLNGSLRLGRVTGFGGVSAFRQVTDGSNLSTDVSNSAVGWSARGNATLGITPTLDLQASAMYRAPMKAELGRVAAMTMTNVALRQKLFGDQASVTLRVTDPFNLMGMGFVTDDGRFYQTSRRSFGARGVFLGVSYTFGQAPRTRPRGAEQTEASQPGPDGQPR